MADNTGAEWQPFLRVVHRLHVDRLKWEYQLMHTVSVSLSLSFPLSAIAPVAGLAKAFLLAYVPLALLALLLGIAATHLPIALDRKEVEGRGKAIVHGTPYSDAFLDIPWHRAILHLAFPATAVLAYCFLAAAVAAILLR